MTITAVFVLLVLILSVLIAGFVMLYVFLKNITSYLEDNEASMFKMYMAARLVIKRKYNISLDEFISAYLKKKADIEFYEKVEDY